MAFSPQQRLHELASILRHTHISTLAGYCVVEGQINIGLEWEEVLYVH